MFAKAVTRPSSSPCARSSWLIPGLVVLDISMDQVRNRTVFSFTGRKDAIFEGGYLLYEEALAHIDMRQHQGEYPRIGAVDVFPFVALRNAPIANAVAWSVEFAEQVASRFQLPVYLFAESARKPLRRDIENIREGEYEGFAAKITDPVWKPDFGPDVFPPDKGATIIGARMPIVNLKAYFTTPDEDAARLGGRRPVEPGHRHARRALLPSPRPQPQRGPAEHHGGQLHARRRSTGSSRA